MTDPASSQDSSLPLMVLERIDSVCSEFEMAWHTGSPPALETYLGDTQGAERSELLRELLLLDFDYRSRRAIRWPEDAATIAEVFRQLSIQVQGGAPAGSAVQDHCASSGARFRILRPHAKGGLGEVFVAFDQELNREVALKEIQQQHAHSTTSRNRFRLEAEVTGRLEHPGIVPVYSLGARDDGQPYYTMRFVRGDSLSEAVRGFHERTGVLSPTSRTVEFRKLLGQFVKVCHTIAYAHSRGVLHRDIKPDNIMLGSYGETLVVDWGLAKTLVRDGATAEAADEPDMALCPDEAGAAATRAGVAIGTPVFMSPEQAMGRPDKIDQRSDIYALGAVLYTILAGHAPIKSDSAAEALRKVQAGEFAAPRAVNPSIPRALEAVCVKAMALRPEDRYDSAIALADDMEAWLADESVSAYREPVIARARRWLRRHQTPVAAAVAAALVAIVSLVLSVALLTAKNRQLVAANAREQVARDHAQQRFGLALEAIEGYYTGVSEDVLLKQTELRDLKTRLLHKPLDFYEVLLKDLAHDTTAQSRAALSDAYYSVAQILAECDSVDRALEAIHKAIGIREALAAAHPQNAAYPWGVVASYASLASLQARAGKSREALATNRLALEMTESLSERFTDHPGSRMWRANLHNNIGFIQEQLNQLNEAEASFQTAIDIRAAMLAENSADDQQRRILAGHYHNLASVRAAHGDRQQAIQDSLQAVGIQEQVYKAYPDSNAGRSDLAMGYYNVANHYRELGARPQAIAFYERSIQIWEGLVEELPNLSAWQTELGKALNNLAELEYRQGELDAGFAHLEKAMAIHQRLAQTYPKVPDYQVNLANHHQNVGTMYDSQGNHQSALDNLQKAIEIHERLVAGFPEIADCRFHLCESQRSLGRLLRRMDQVDRATEAFQQAVATCGQLVDEHPNVVAYRGQMALLWNSLALAQQAAGRIDDARTSYDRAIDIGSRLAGEVPGISLHAVRLGAAYCNRAHLEQRSTDLTTALPWYSKAIDTLSTALSHDDADPEARQFLLNSHWGRAKAFTSLQRYDEAMADWDRVIALDRRGSEAPHWERAFVEVLSGAHASATIKARRLACSSNASGSTLYSAARLFASAATAALDDESLAESLRQDLANQYAAESIELLRGAQGRDYFVPADRAPELDQDPLFDPLRARDEFQQWRATLPASSVPPSDAGDRNSPTESSATPD